MLRTAPAPMKRSQKRRSRTGSPAACCPARSRRVRDAAPPAPWTTSSAPRPTLVVRADPRGRRRLPGRAAHAGKRAPRARSAPQGLGERQHLTVLVHELRTHVPRRLADVECAGPVVTGYALRVLDAPRRDQEHRPPRPIDHVHVTALTIAREVELRSIDIA